MQITKAGIIYKVVNKIDGKCYIGQTTKKLKNRKLEHFYISNKKNTNSYFHNAIRKYGEENFEWKVIEECETKNELDEMEYHYIKQYNTFAPGGYNLTWGGYGIYGYIHNDKTKEKISKTSLECWKNPEYRKKVITKERNKKIAKTMSKILIKNWKNPKWRDKQIKLIKNATNTAKYKEFCRKRMIELYKNPNERIEQGKRVSQNWLVINPLGVYLKVKNLLKFCKSKNGFYYGLCRVAKKRQDNYKGWKCEKIEVLL